MFLAFWTPGIPEILVLLVLGLILFGGNLPEVGKSIGRNLVEFRKGLRDLKDEAGIDEVSQVRNDLQNIAREADPRRLLDRIEAEEDAKAEASRAEDGQDPEGGAASEEGEGQDAEFRELAPEEDGGQGDEDEKGSPPTLGFDRHS